MTIGYAAKVWTAALALVIALVAVGCGPAEQKPAEAPSAVPNLPDRPVTLNIIDVAGNLALTQEAIERYRDTHPELVRKINFTKAPSPELAAKVKAQADAGRVDIDLVLTGTDALSAGLDQNLWLDLLPRYEAKFPGFEDNLLAPAVPMQELAKNRGLVVNYYPSGPLLEYTPERVDQPPRTAQELMSWAKSNPGRFTYARPANSGPGRTFLMGCPTSSATRTRGIP